MADYQCIDCKKYDENNTNRYGEGYCTYYCRYFPKSDRRCSNNFEKRDDYSSGCFLTTTICNIFGMKDDCYGLNVMRKFRDTVLVNDSRYYPLLAEYEVVGPIISEKMYKDEHGLEVAEYYFEHYIYDIIMNLSIRKDYNEAVEKYVEMVNDLKRMYGVTKEITNEDVDLLTNQIKNKQYKVKKLVRTK